MDLIQNTKLDEALLNSSDDSDGGAGGDSKESGDLQPLLLRETVTRVYATRFWVLFVFVNVCFIQNIAWITFSTIFAEAKAEYGISANQINLLAALGNVGFLLVAPFNSFITSRLGLQHAVLFAAATISTGCLVRALPHYVFSSPHHSGSWFFLLGGQSLICLANAVCGSSASLLSASWFPARERSTATTTAFLAEGAGLALAFKLGPAVAGGGHVRKLLQVELLWAVTVLVLVLVHFPSKPPIAPSVSAATKRLPFWEGLRKLLGNWQYLVLVAAVAIPGGVMLGWSMLLDNMFEGTFSEATIGWVGFVPNMAAPAVGIPVGIAMDRLGCGFKWVIVAEMFMTCAVFFGYVYLRDADNKPGVFWSSIVGLTLANIVGAPGYELAAEQSFPVSEDMSAMFISFCWNVVTLTFVLVKSVVPFTPLDWMLVSSFGAFGLAVALLPNSFSRGTMDWRPHRIAAEHNRA